MSVNPAGGPIRIHQIHMLPTTYSNYFYRVLYENPEIDLRVYHLFRESCRHPRNSTLAMDYHNTYMNLILGIDWSLLKTAWYDTESFFIVGDWAYLPTVAVILARWVRGAPVGVWADTPQEDICRPPLKKWLRSKYLRWLLPKLDIVFGTGKKALRLLRGMGARQERLVDLPYIVDLDRPRQASQEPEIKANAQQFRNLVGCASKGIVFSMLGNFIPRKGVDIGLQAFARCLRQVQKPLGLLIAGEGPERQKLQLLADKLDLGNSVAFLGWQEPEGVEAVYLGSDVVLHPARSDPFPVVILDAMNWSKLVIGSDVCGNVEDRIVHGVNGFSFPSEDVEELSRIMLHLVNQSENIRKIGRRARQTAEEWPAQRGVNIVLETAKNLLSAR
ncbi:MAG: glycosyltransferase family 1 protein [Proteobacteria bacterium]|nr:glycosyltransferase family 1 protein [Pseudomonadota bacterium]MBU4357537.1 glycosyltransferase family 1 protein [Pseudomonadota bacterium]